MAVRLSVPVTVKLTVLSQTVVPLAGPDVTTSSSAAWCRRRS